VCMCACICPYPAWLSAYAEPSLTPRVWVSLVYGFVYVLVYTCALMSCECVQSLYLSTYLHVYISNCLSVYLSRWALSETPALIAQMLKMLMEAEKYGDRRGAVRASPYAPPTHPAPYPLTHAHTQTQTHTYIILYADARSLTEKEVSMRMCGGPLHSLRWPAYASTAHVADPPVTDSLCLFVSLPLSLSLSIYLCVCMCAGAATIGVWPGWPGQGSRHYRPQGL
jgi:hypothetical protein